MVTTEIARLLTVFVDPDRVPFEAPGKTDESCEEVRVAKACGTKMADSVNSSWTFMVVDVEDALNGRKGRNPTADGQKERRSDAQYCTFARGGEVQSGAQVEIQISCLSNSKSSERLPNTFFEPLWGVLASDKDHVPSYTFHTTELREFLPKR